MSDMPPLDVTPVHFIADGIRRVESFADAMRAKGIHVGVGSVPVCVTCGEPWPCEEGRYE